MNGQSNTDVMQLFVVMTASVFGPSMSAVIGPYLLIIFAAATGAAWSLGRRESKGKKDAFFYFIRIVFTAIVLTVVISKIAAGFLPNVDADLLIAPVALIIGLIGDDWNKIASWILVLLKRMLERKTGQNLDDK